MPLIYIPTEVLLWKMEPEGTAKVVGRVSFYQKDVFYSSVVNAPIYFHHRCSVQNSYQTAKACCRYWGLCLL